jgi:NADPH2:quinone reductase
VLSLLNFVRKTGIYSPIPLMMQSKAMVGVNMLKIADDNPSVLSYHLKQCFDHYKNQVLMPIPATSFHHSELHLAHELLESGNSTGKLVVYWGDLD